ncbi:MAG: SET domain-containing protein-lysine N-methyltransferase [Nitrososphaerales archaeon]|nr:SET domain-containing protein-lysine N-methyltransferase [Nitrososphaerales archaeon]
MTRGMAPLVVRKVGERGLGVVAQAEIGAGEAVVRYGGKPRWIWEIPKWCWAHSFQVDYDRYVVPRVGSAGWCINHSCDPNCSVSGEREIVAIRGISKGEELTFDYSTNVGWDGFAMECRCGEKNCRKMIRSYASLAPDLKRKYRGHVSPFLLRQPKRQRPTLF